MRYRDTNADGELLSSAYVFQEHHESGAPDPFGLDCSNLPSLTRQEFAEECDINALMSHYEKTGLISHINPRTPQYLDVSDVPDLATAHQIIETATAEFMALPANVRREFDNDPMTFVAFAQNPDNIDRMREWGLAPPKADPPAPAKPEASVAPAAKEDPPPKS